ncbi:antitoxin YefM [Aurantimicrobium minutum]|uniref:type II toxin-antitoxin system Phd/YefM family antitoxin n=1 Tax=Aurantimicrobium minutum TaxID=708131 RepID=UPI00240494AF|nr:type II toxin-antitoxin system Phd/YefM family antitoxin [Aurantimicrobium minutum]MDF9809750.1 antitoxin YefM [Aurantimicrobium minutum]
MTTLPLAEARANLSKLVEAAVTTQEIFEITRNGVRDAVLMSADEYDSLIETIDILGDEETMVQLRVALAQQKAGLSEAVEKETLLASIAARMPE